MKSKVINREIVGLERPEIMDVPHLVAVQTDSYERFLQLSKVRSSQKLQMLGLEEVFQNTFPITSAKGDMLLEYNHYTIDSETVNYTEEECKRKGLTYAGAIKARISLVLLDTGEVRQKDIYFGDIPLMTERGTFIINGAERVVVSQIHRSPGVIFSHEKGEYFSRIIPSQGSWLGFEIDHKRDLMYVKIDRKTRILITLFLRALGIKTREEIIQCFYKSRKVTLSTQREAVEEIVGNIFAKNIVLKDGDTERIVRYAGHKIHPHDIDELIHSNVKTIDVIDMDAPESLHSLIIINCFEREETKFEFEKLDPTQAEALEVVFSAINPGEPIMLEHAESDLRNMFFSERQYNLGRVGRYKLNKKFNYPNADEIHDQVLTLEDIINTVRCLIQVYIGEENIDDIDHLGNRRVRSVGELLVNVLKGGFGRMERTARERMAVKEIEAVRPQDIISIKPIISAIKEFFGSSQLSQFMDQVNPLAELTHKRRLNALGPGGVSRERAGAEIRDVHYSHYGRMCPIETPEGPSIGLIVSLSNYARVNEYGFLETPYRKVVDGKVTNEIEYLSAIDEERYAIAQANTLLNKDNVITSKFVSARKKGDYVVSAPKEVQYMDVSPKQIVSTSAALIPFLEHDDANRALMGANMQRQAVPLLFPDAPRVGTNMEGKAAYDSGVLVKTRCDGIVKYVASDKIVIQPTKQQKGSSKTADANVEPEVYPLIKFRRTNQDTCYNQKVLVRPGDVVKKGEVIADGPATSGGELALGQNMLVGFVPWNGYNFEDAILISQRVVKEDMFTSIHLKEFQMEVRETKLGPEKITRDIPNIAESALAHLDENGVIHIGARITSGSILVGKVTPRGESDTTPEFKLLNAIFGEKAKDVRDTSLYVPHGIDGTVIDIQRLSRSNGDELNPGVEEIVKILIAVKRKLQEGDKMAGRHGNKGVVARVLPEEDMPYMADGTPLDVCLNPVGVPSRMNLGQMLETQLGFAAWMFDKWYATPVFDSPSSEEIVRIFKDMGVKKTEKTVLYDGLTGAPFENPVFVGMMYMLKLHHLVDDKMHARSIGPYSLVTQQPLGGKAQFGGQRLGEMEVWALEAYGASQTLQEMLTIKSDDMSGRAKIYESIVKSEPTGLIGVPESFNVLVQELRGLGLDLSIYDGKNKRISLTERDEELINQQDSNF